MDSLDAENGIATAGARADPCRPDVSYRSDCQITGFLSNRATSCSCKSLKPKKKMTDGRLGCPPPRSKGFEQS